MGRRFLLTASATLVLALAACADPAADPGGDAGASGDGTSAVAPDMQVDRGPHADGATLVGGGVPMEDGAHAGLACARCHDGAAIARGTRPATADACRDCHDSGVATVSLGGITIEHHDHGGADALVADCAACHTHPSGDLELGVTTTGCALCHAASLDGASAEGCRLCHTDPAHVALTSQNVPVMHSDLPWIGGECVRCHYDVGRPGTRVAGSTCAGCHRDVARITELGAGRDLHPSHTDVSCSSCHENVAHRIVAMSSAVELGCTQCHATVHDVARGSEFDAATCNGCHTAVHAAEQRLTLGVAPAGMAAMPGDKFLIGMTCRSCHVQTAEGSTTSTSCVSCHSPEYAQVLRWWERGSAERIALTRTYVAGAATAAAPAGADSARIHAAAADSLLEFVRQGISAHNMPLSHRALEEAVARASAAYVAAGRSAPARPDLGRMPRMGQCTYCHYEWREPRFQLDMPDAFHRRVMSRGEAAARSIGITP